MNIIEAVINLVDQLILTYVLGAFTDLSPTVEALWRVMFIIFIALYGYRVVFSGSFNFNDLILNTLKIVVILIMATAWGTFSVFVFDSFTEVPNEVAGRILSGTTSSIGGTATAGDTATANNALGSYFDRGIGAGNAVVEKASWYDVGLFFYALFIWITTILLTGYGLMLIVLSKLAVSILLAIGPIFILLLMFNISRGFFEGWLRGLVNFAVIPVFVYAVLALTLRVVEGPLTALATNASSDTDLVTYIGPFALLSIIGFALLAQVTSMAAGLSGGFALSTMNWAGNMARRLGGTAGTVAGGGRPGREVRELGYLRSTASLQNALTNARYGNPSDRARLRAGIRSQGPSGGSIPSARKTSGAVAPPRAGTTTPAPSERRLPPQTN